MRALTRPYYRHPVSFEQYRGWTIKTTAFLVHARKPGVPHAFSRISLDVVKAEIDRLENEANQMEFPT